MTNVFEVVPDPVSRAAMEEIFIPGVCKSVLGDYDAPPGVDSQNPGFPPEPAEILTISAAHLRAGAPNGIKQEFISLSLTLPSISAAVRLHRASVDARHTAMASLLTLTRGVPHLGSSYEMRKLCLDAVRMQGRRLIAAHMIAKIARNGELVDALVLPREVSEDIPFLIRDAISPYASQLDLNSPRLKPLKKLMRGDLDARESAAIVAATFLPKSTALKYALLQTQIARRRKTQNS